MVVAVATAADTRALSIDGALARRLDSGPIRGKVHSVFQHVVNIVTPDEQLFSMCARDLDDAPWTVRVDVPHWRQWDMHTGAAAHVDHEGVTLQNGQRVGLAGARVWDPAGTPIEAGLCDLNVRAAELDNLIHSLGVAGGALRNALSDPFSVLVGEQIDTMLDAIARAEIAGAPDDLAEAAGSMLGLGVGLTPAGDDVLTGLALVAARPGSLTTHVLPAVRAALRRHPDRTTLLSRTTLSCAAEGRARQQLVDLLDALVSSGDPHPAPLRAAAARVIGIGHTSGTDIAYGVLAGIALEMQLRGSVCQSPQ